MPSSKKKSSGNGFLVYMTQVRDELARQGIHKQMSAMAEYCSKDWQNMPKEEKAKYKANRKKLNNEGCDVKYTSIGEKVEDVQKRAAEIKSQTLAMYQYIEELVRVNPTSYYLPKHKFILIHINPYSCETEGFYFPAEISMVEFSLEKGLIRIFHQLLGFDKHRTKAPSASAAEINNHAKNYHLITPYTTTKFPDNYTDILLKIIGFIINKAVDETVLYDYDLDMPPIYTAHSTLFNELLTTTSSLYQLYQIVVKDAQQSFFNQLFKIYHLDKLFMEMKNVAYKIRHPEIEHNALPSVAMATESLSKDMLNVFTSIGCSFHENNEKESVCSNFYACKWIYILSVHCCQFFNINLIPGRHYDFDLSAIGFPLETLETNVAKLNISKTCDSGSNTPKKNSQDLPVNSFPPIIGGTCSLSTLAKKPTWNRPHLQMNTSVENTLLKKVDNFPLLGSSTRPVQENSSGVGMNWGRNAGFRDRVNKNQVSNSVGIQIGRNLKVPTEGRRFSLEKSEK